MASSISNPHFFTLDPSVRLTDNALRNQYRSLVGQHLARNPDTAHRAVKITQRVTVSGPGCRVLDVGCGDGHQAAAYWRDSNVSFIAVTDITADAITSVRNLLHTIRPLTNQNSCTLVGKLGDSSSTLLQDLRAALTRQGSRDGFDIIVLDRVLSHIHPLQHAAVLDQLAELLSADGRLVFSRPHHRPCPGVAYTIHGTASNGQIAMVHSTSSIQMAPASLYECCKNEIRALLLPQIMHLEFVSWIPQSQLAMPQGGHHHQAQPDATVWREALDIEGRQMLVGQPINRPLQDRLAGAQLSWSNYSDAIRTPPVWDQILNNLMCWHQRSVHNPTGNVWATATDIVQATVICKRRSPQSSSAGQASSSRGSSGPASSSRDGAGPASSSRSGSCDGAGLASSSRGGVA